MLNSNLSSYQNPEGLLKDRLAPRTDKRLSMIPWKQIQNSTVLDIGCNNGYFVREAMKRGAVKAVGVDKSNCIIGARELAKEEGVNAEFWQVNIDSKEFRRHCPKFDVVFLLSVLTHLKDKEDFLDWLDDRINYQLIFESNHGESNKNHIDLVRKHIHFNKCQYLGLSDIPEKPHHLWVLTKDPFASKYPEHMALPVEFIPIEKIVGITESFVLKQDNKYNIYSEKFNLLKEDIKKRRIREPIVVKKSKHGTYSCFQGSHRYWVAKQLGYKSIPCRVIK